MNSQNNGITIYTSMPYLTCIMKKQTNTHQCTALNLFIKLFCLLSVSIITIYLLLCKSILLRATPNKEYSAKDLALTCICSLLELAYLFSDVKLQCYFMATVMRIKELIYLLVNIACYYL